MRSSEFARTVVLHLGAGDEVGEHQAGQRQLLLVVRGSGWVSGADRVRIAVSEDQAAIFEAGELHAAGTSEGMVAVSVEGAFSPDDL